MFPLIVEAVRGVQMSVGRPYFDRMAVPDRRRACCCSMGVGPALPWGRATPDQVRRALLPPARRGPALAAAIGLALGVRTPWTLLTLAFAGFTAQVTAARAVPCRWRAACARTARASARRCSSPR